MTDAPTHGRRAWIACAVLLGIAAIARLPTLGQPLLEAHAFRQTQTALTALIYHQQGIDLLRPQLPVFGPPWMVPFEFPLFQAAASLLMDAGIGPDTAMRSMGLATFLLTGALLFGLLRHVTGDITAVIGLIAFLFSPFGLIFGRTSMIEYLATAGSVGFLWAGVAWADRGAVGAHAGAMVAGSVGTLTKIATGGFYLLPLLFYRGRLPMSRSHLALLAVLMIVPLAVALAWTSYADRVKLAGEATAWLAVGGGAMRDWNFGDVADRFDLGKWGQVLRPLTANLTGFLLPVWMVLGGLAVWAHPQRRFLIAFLALCTLAPIVVFMPLYVIHDYYLAAISPAIATLIGLGGAWLWRHRRARVVRGVAVALAVVWLVAFALRGGYWGRAYGPVVDRERTLEAAAYIESRTRPDDWVVLSGRDWNPSVFYYAGRRGFMVRPSETETQLIEELDQDPRYTLFVDCPPSASCRLMDPAD
jgi:hypothetical protein